MNEVTRNIRNGLLGRRQALMCLGAVSAAPGGAQAQTRDPVAGGLVPVPMRQVRLLPSIWYEALLRNQRYLLSLSADRLLSNFRKFAGLVPKGAVYGGWESDTIAGHTLGHYLSALCLMSAQTGDAACGRRVDYIVRELAAVQKAQGDGYVAGFTRKGAGGKIEDGKVIFAEIARGDIRSGGFDLNGAWSPLYNVHKTFAGLLDAHALCGNAQALEVAIGFAAYFYALYQKLDEAQLQSVLTCEYGGLNESFAELFARTGDVRWRDLARRTYDHRVLDPLSEGQDDLPHHHANTQIPKIIGLARLNAVAPDPHIATIPQFFWGRVVNHQSFVNGGNADREYFLDPDTTSQHLTEQTCEHCNTYNMLKLSRALYEKNGRSEYFDYYERAHLNHVMAAHDPKNGMFTYMTPMITGGVRQWSTPTEDFWCCVGTGMESHAKHGDSIWWEDGPGLVVNLFIPSIVQWPRMRAEIRLQTRYPFDGAIALSIKTLSAAKDFPLSLRVPAWAKNRAVFELNGQPITPEIADGYARVDRRWAQGDRLVMRLPMDVRTISPVENARDVTFATGPMLLAADLGPVEAPFDAIDPALVSDHPVADLQAVRPEAAIYRTRQAGRPGQLTLVPFFSQYRRRSALYLQCFSAQDWAREQVDFRQAQERARDIARRTIDIVHLGEMQPEHDHRLISDQSWPLVYRNRNGRDLRRGGFIAFTMMGGPGALELQFTMWGQDVPKAADFRVLVDGQTLPPATSDGSSDHGFVVLRTSLSGHAPAARKAISVRLEAPSRTAGPFFGIRLVRSGGKAAL